LTQSSDAHLKDGMRAAERAAAITSHSASLHFLSTTRRPLGDAVDKSSGS